MLLFAAVNKDCSLPMCVKNCALEIILPGEPFTIIKFVYWKSHFQFRFYIFFHLEGQHPFSQLDCFHLVVTSFCICIYTPKPPYSWIFFYFPLHEGGRDQKLNFCLWIVLFPVYCILCFSSVHSQPIMKMHTAKFIIRLPP